jgi:hypothetical protein
MQKMLQDLIACFIRFLQRLHAIILLPVGLFGLMRSRRAMDADGIEPEVS